MAKNHHLCTDVLIHSSSKMVRRTKRPTLIHMLPEEGFDWRSIHGNKPLVSGNTHRKIAFALKTLMPVYTTEQIARAIGLMFNAATQHINGPLTMTPQEFWGEIKPQVTWLRELDTETILLFSWSALGARHVASEVHEAQVEMEGNDPADYPMPNSAASQAVDDFVSKIVDTQNFAVRYAFIPGWIHDRHNQGDRESTEAAFLAAVEKSELDRKAGKAKKEVEMEEGEEDKGDRVNLVSAQEWYGLGTTQQAEDGEDVEMGEGGGRR